MFYTYVLQSEKNKEIYIGFTSDLKHRLLEHNQGLNFSTKRYMPWKLVCSERKNHGTYAVDEANFERRSENHGLQAVGIYYEACVEESDARRREKYLKTTQGGRLLKRRIKDYLYHDRKI